MLDVFAAAAGDLPDVPLPDRVTLRALAPDEGDLVESLYKRADDSIGDREIGAPNPWPAVHAALAVHPHRIVLIAEMDGQAVGIATVHTHKRTAWLRGMADGARGTWLGHPARRDRRAREARHRSAAATCSEPRHCPASSRRATLKRWASD